MAIALAAYNFIIKYRVEKINPTDVLLRRPLGVKSPPGRRHHATINLKDFRNAGPLTQGKYPIKCTIQESEPSIKVLFL